MTVEYFAILNKPFKVLKKLTERGAIYFKNLLHLTLAIRNVWDFEAVAYPTTLNLIKGITAQTSTNTHIFFIAC